VLDHYDIEAGRRRPQDGLDQELKDVIAALLGYAAMMLSRVLDRAILDAKAEAPKVSLALDTAGIWLATPKRALMKHAENAAARAIVAAQYAEFRRTGKVRETLSDDDKAVRRLHAEEVLKVSLSSLDCQWPRETGTANGQGAEPRTASKRKPKVSAEQVREAKAAPPPAPKKSASPAARPAAKSEPKTPKPAPVAAQPAHSPPRIRLTREASVVDAPSIGPKTAGRLSVIGVKTVGDLLALSPDEAAKQIKQSHINVQIIKDWQAQALLACSVPELSGTAAQLLVGAGVTSVEDLATSDLDALIDAVAMFAASNEGERVLRSSPVPGRDVIKSWIESALAICEGRNAA
jgi:predicted flap endonuclease-1-like 5' DNA nuclease